MAPVAALRLTAAPLRASMRSTTRVGVSRRSLVVRAFRESDEPASKSIKETREELMSNLNTGATEVADKVQAYWEASEDKPTIIAVGFGALLALYFTDNIVSAVDRLPLISTVFELIGLVFTGWTAYRFFLVDGEKEKLITQAKDIVGKIGIDL